MAMGTAACASTDIPEPLPPIVEFTPVLVPVIVPDSFFICPKRPDVPKPIIDESTGNAFIREEDAKDYILVLRNAHQQCEASLKAVRNEMITQKQIVEDSNPTDAPNLSTNLSD